MEENFRGFKFIRDFGGVCLYLN